MSGEMYLTKEKQNEMELFASRSMQQEQEVRDPAYLTMDRQALRNTLLAKQQGAGEIPAPLQYGETEQPPLDNKAEKKRLKKLQTVNRKNIVERRNKRQIAMQQLNDLQINSAYIYFKPQGMEDADYIESLQDENTRTLVTEGMKNAVLYENHLTPDIFTPQYIANHLEEVIALMDRYRGFFKLCEEEDILKTEEDKVMFEQVRELYDQAEAAYTAALKSGFIRIENSAVSRVDKLTEEDVQPALEENENARKKMAELSRNMLGKGKEKTIGRLISRQAERLAYQQQAEQRVGDYIESLYLDNSPAYAQNKELVDRLLKEYTSTIHTLEYLPIREQAMDAYYADRRERFGEAGAEQEEERTKISEQIRNLNERRRMLEEGLDFILEGKKISDEKIAKSLIARGVPVSGVSEEMDAVKLAEERATADARIDREQTALLKETIERYMKEKKERDPNARIRSVEEMMSNGGNRFARLMRKGQDAQNMAVVEAVELSHELGKDYLKSKEVGRKLKPIILAELSKIRDFNLEEMKALDKEGLMEKNEELQELWLGAQTLNDFANCIDPDAEDGSSIKENFVGTKKACMF